MEEVLESGRRFHVPQQDLYGNLNYHVREKLEATCQRLQKHKVSIYLFGLDIPDLPPRLKTVFPEQTCMSDRIDVASLAERDSFGLALTLNTLGPLLKPVDMNPKAALIAIFPHAAIATEKRTRVRTIGMPPNIPDGWRQPLHTMVAEDEVVQNILWTTPSQDSCPFPQPSWGPSILT